MSTKAWMNVGILTTLLLGSVWWVQSPLTSSRPKDPQVNQLIDASFPVEKPFARIWQDPFEPYFDKLRQTGEKGNALSDEELNCKLKRIFREDFESRFKDRETITQEDLLLVGIMVPGGPFEDRTERRQRIRVALASAMAAGGYAPVDSEHLGSFPFEPWRSDEKNEIVNAANGTPPFKIPYEWFSKLSNEERRYISFPSKYENILVFWISDDHFAETPIALLHRLRKQVDESLAETSPANSLRVPELKAELKTLFSLYDVPLFEGEMTSFTALTLPSMSWESVKQPSASSLREKLARAEFAIFGPWSSTTLKKILLEADQCQNDKSKKEKYESSKLSFYNVFATASPSSLRDDDDTQAERDIRSADRKALVEIGGELQAVLGNKDKVFHYTTCPDSDLAEAMKDELVRRGVNLKSDQIAFIAENDTIYGRLLPKTFRRVFWGRGPVENVERFTYLRGLDGRVPQEKPKTESPSPTIPGTYGVNARTSIESRFMPTRKTNRPEGNNQFDYIIRLGDEMLQMEKTNGQFKVIGILGSDIYDKLLLLQALKPSFPNAIFFTTDLDASYSHPQELEWTKNLLVASTHGLTLNKDMQCGIPPFRFSYQTAAFQAILGATTETKNEIPKSVHDAFLSQAPARIFEIGWYQPYDISVAMKAPASVASSAPDPLTPTERVYDKDIQPPRRETSIDRFFKIVVFTGLTILPLTLISLFILNWHRKVFRIAGTLIRTFFSPFTGADRSSPKNKSQKAKPQKTSKKSRSVTDSGAGKIWTVWAPFALLILVFSGLCVYGYVIWCDNNAANGEPWGWGTGISVWPSTTLRLIALIVSAILLYVVVFDKARKVAKNLTSRFDLEGLPEYLHSNLGESFGKIRDMVAKLAFPKKKEDEKTGKIEINIEALWKEQNNEIPGRVLLDTIIGLVASAIVLYLLACEGNGHFPYRSPSSYGIGVGIWGFAWVATMMLVLATFFITRSCCRFIKEMEKGTVVWPKMKESDNLNVLNRFSKRWEIKDYRCFTHLVDVYFIEAWASKICGLVLYPIASLVLLFTAESPYFDNYGYNPYRYLVLVFMGLLIFAPAFQLRSAVRKLRTQKIRRQREYLEFHYENASEPARKKVEAAIKETEDLKDGAFEPFLEHPFMQAVLFLIGGISLPAFLGLLNRPF